MARLSRAALARLSSAFAVALLAGCVQQGGPPPPVVDLTTGAGSSASSDAVAAAPAVAQLPQAQPLHDGLPPDGHVVQQGDSLYGIAWRYGLDYRKLAETNGIAPPYRIVVGQRLQLAAPGGPAPAPGIVGSQGAIAATGTAPAMVPAEPSSRGFEFIPDAPADPQSAGSQQGGWQDMPPPAPAPGGAGVAYGTSGVVTAPAPVPSPGPAVGAPAVIAAPPAPVGVQPIGGAPVGQAPAPSGPPPATVGGLEPPAQSAPLPATPDPASTVASLPPPAAAAPIPEPEVAPTPIPQALPAPAQAPASAGGVGAWRWPATGSVQKSFGNGNKGIDFKLDANQPVVAAGGGEVVYAGNGLGGFRHLVIVKHDQRFLSAYSLNRAIVVKEGERVESGGMIAGAEGAGGGAGTLRFEIRRDGQPVDPAGIIGR